MAELLITTWMPMSSLLSVNIVMEKFSSPVSRSF